jgi:hypothetical protein
LYFKPIDAKSLLKLKFHKNAEGKYHCPVLYKTFSNNSHIVVVQTTGNVFSYEVGFIKIIRITYNLPYCDAGD